MSDNAIHVTTCPTCGALAQCIAGDPVTYRRVSLDEHHDRVESELRAENERLRESRSQTSPSTSRRTSGWTITPAKCWTGTARRGISDTPPSTNS